MDTEILEIMRETNAATQKILADAATKLVYRYRVEALKPDLFHTSMWAARNDIPYERYKNHEGISYVCFLNNDHLLKYKEDIAIELFGIQYDWKTMNDPIKRQLTYDDYLIMQKKDEFHH